MSRRPARRFRALVRFALLATLAAILMPPAPALAQSAAVLAEIDQGMERYRLDAHIPGMVWGVVKDGRLVHAKGAGVQDIESKRPVTAETLFRIASMTKAFTALSVLKLRDDGKLALDAPAETYVPELQGLAAADRGLGEDPRPRAHHPHRRLRHRRSVGRSADAAARGRVHGAAARRGGRSPGRRRRRWSTRTSATRCSAASSPTSRAGRTRTSCSGRC